MGCGAGCMVRWDRAVVLMMWPTPAPWVWGTKLWTITLADIIKLVNVDRWNNNRAIILFL